MLGETFLNDGMFVRGVVVRNKMQGLDFGRLAVEFLQELQSLGKDVAQRALSDHLPVQCI
jgi:hypothetical protein